MTVWTGKKLLLSALGALVLLWAAFNAWFYIGDNHRLARAPELAGLDRQGDDPTGERRAKGGFGELVARLVKPRLGLVAGLACGVAPCPDLVERVGGHQAALVQVTEALRFAFELLQLFVEFVDPRFGGRHARHQRGIVQDGQWLAGADRLAAPDQAFGQLAAVQKGQVGALDGPYHPRQAQPHGWFAVIDDGDANRLCRLGCLRPCLRLTGTGGRACQHKEPSQERGDAGDGPLRTGRPVSC